MKAFPSSVRSFIYRHLAAVGIILAATFAIQPVRPFLAIQIIVLIYLLPIMISTVLWGLTPGVLASLLAFLAFNYYFIEPYHTLQVHSTQDLITLIIFLIVAVVMSQLIGQAREGIRLAHSREWEATCMYELISGLAGLQDSKSIAEILASHTFETFGCVRVETVIKAEKNQGERVVVYPETAEKGPQPTLSPGRGLQDQENLHRKDAKNAKKEENKMEDIIRLAPSEGPTTRIPLMTARGTEGEIRIWRYPREFSAEELRLIEAFSSQGALALERVRLTQGENKARVLEESDRLKTSLLNSVSHELRSPLAAIKASVSSLRSGTVDWEAEARQDLLETIEEETDHLNLLVGNLLDMSRIESGALKPHLRWNAIGEIVRGVAAKMRKQLVEHQLVIAIDEALPMVPSDYVMMEQVFSNLISNSIKYAPAHSTIEVSASKEGEYLHITLTNQGPLVPEEHLERIFDKFNRVTEADRITGTGLGLSICKGIVEAHKGKIWAQNQGCCFAFHLLLPCTINGSRPELPKEASHG
jgi:two-component system sensor histidine kinase KdpD